MVGIATTIAGFHVRRLQNHAGDEGGHAVIVASSLVHLTFPRTHPLSSMLDFTDKPETKRASRNVPKRMPPSIPPALDAPVDSTGSDGDHVGGDGSVNSGWSATRWK